MKKQYKNLNDINMKTPDGEMLFHALAIITSSPQITINGQNLNGCALQPDEALMFIAQQRDKFNKMYNDGTQTD